MVPLTHCNNLIAYKQYIISKKFVQLIQFTDSYSIQYKCVIYHDFSNSSITTTGSVYSARKHAPNSLTMDDHFVTINYYADISEDSSNDKTSTSEPRLQIHDDRVSTETSSPGKRRMSVVQPKVVRHRLLATVGILFIIGLFSIPVVLYYTQDKVDLSTLTAVGNITVVSIIHIIMYTYVSCIRLW